MRVLRNAVNPFSTGFTRWWCRSDLRALRNGKPRGTYKGLAPRRAGQPRPLNGTAPPADPAVMRARAAAIDRLMAEQENKGGQ
jgi:hypothetical protein